MIRPIGLNQSDCREAGNDLRSGLGWAEALRKLLQDQAGGDDDLGDGQRKLQRPDFRFSRIDVAAQRKQPATGVDEQRHLRDRSAL